MELNKYIEPTRAHEEQMVEVRDHDNQSWSESRLLRVLDQPQRFRFICEDSGSRELCNKWKQARIWVPKTPEELHKESGFTVGDWVRVTVPKADKRFDAKVYTLNHYGKEPLDKAHEMNGKIGQIVPGTSSRMFVVTEHGNKDLPCFLLPCFFLEKVDPPAPPTEEIVHVPGTVEHWIYKGHAYRMATAGDTNKKCIVSDLSVECALQKVREHSLTKVDPTSPYLYRTGCAGWKYALIQDDSLLKPALKEEYVPYTWEDIGSILGKKFRAVNANGVAWGARVGRVIADLKGLVIEDCRTEWLVKNATHVDDNNNDTGIPFGKKVVH